MREEGFAVEEGAGGVEGAADLGREGSEDDGLDARVCVAESERFGVVGVVDGAVGSGVLVAEDGEVARLASCEPAALELLFVVGALHHVVVGGRFLVAVNDVANGLELLQGECADRQQAFPLVAEHKPDGVLELLLRVCIVAAGLEHAGAAVEVALLIHSEQALLLADPGAAAFAGHDGSHA